MKTSLPLALLVSLHAYTCAAVSSPPMPSVTSLFHGHTPTTLQRDFTSRGYGLFIHLGISTVNENLPGLRQTISTDSF